MPPWSDQLNKSQTKLNTEGIGWKNLMRESLIKTEIFPMNALKSPSLDPNVLMDMRHKMLRTYSFSKIFPTPREQIQAEVVRLLREENHKRLLKQKDERLVQKEIERLKKILENRRIDSKKAAEEPNMTTVVPKFSKRYRKFWKRLQSYEGVCEFDTWVTESLQMTMETKMSPCGVLFDVKVHLQGKEEGGDSRPASCQRGSVVEDEDSWKCMESGKKEIMQRFLEGSNEIVEECQDISKEEIYFHIVNRAAGRKLEQAWKVWRIYTLNRRKQKQEKSECERKIEAFLSKLREKRLRENLVDSQKRPVKTYDQSRRLNAVERAKTAEVLRQEKNKELQRLVRDIKVSQKEAHERLVTIERERPENSERAKVLKTFSHVQEPLSDNRKRFPNPKFLSRMEKRREERSNRWREIREKKLKLEKERENLQKLRQEEERAMEDREKRRKTEELKEMRRLEKERQEEAKRGRERLKTQREQAERHYKKLLLKNYGFSPWLGLMKLRELQIRQAVEHDEGRLQQRALARWKSYVADQTERKLKEAEGFRRRQLLRSCLHAWIEHHMERVRHLQVAIDWNELRVTERVFRCWLRFTEEEQLEAIEKKEVADNHFQRKLKGRYLNFWRKYPEVRRLEIAQEKRKRIWRQKVLEILPDFQPIRISGDS